MQITKTEVTKVFNKFTGMRKMSHDPMACKMKGSNFLHDFNNLYFLYGEIQAQSSIQHYLKSLIISSLST